MVRAKASLAGALDDNKIPLGRGISTAAAAPLTWMSIGRQPHGNDSSGHLPCACVTPSLVPRSGAVLRSWLSIRSWSSSFASRWAAISVVWQSRAQPCDSEQRQCNPRCGEELLEKQCLVQLLNPEECWRLRNKVFVCNQGLHALCQAILRPRKKHHNPLAASKALASKPSSLRALYCCV